MPRKQTEEDAGGELDERILRADSCLAIATATAKQEPAHDRKVVATTDLMTALRTPGPWLHDRFTARHPPNHDVEERADEQPKNTCEQGKHAENLSQH